MKKILIVGDFLTGSGLTRFIFNVFSNLDTNEYKISAVGYGAEKSLKINKKCTELGWLFQRVIPVTKNPVKHWLWWNNFLKKNKFDIIYFNYSSSWNFLPVRLALKNQKAQVVCHSHNSYYSHVSHNKVFMLLLNWLNNIGRVYFNKNVNIKLATSTEAARWMFGTQDNITVVNNGINLNDFTFDYKKRIFLRKKLGIKNGTFLIGFVGVLQNRKNPLFAIDVFNAFCKKIPNSVLLMIGKGELKREIKNKIKKLELNGRVILLDYADNINELYSAMDILIFPSLYEGFGLVPLEAQVSNLPVLASNKVPKQVIVTPNIVQVKTFNVNEWKEKLLKIYNENHVRNSQINTKLLKYSSERQTEEIIEILHRN